jgi:hypothetical protein
MHQGRAEAVSRNEQVFEVKTSKKKGLPGSRPF